MLTALFHGWVLSFGLIMPLGVQNVFVFNQGAQNRRWVRALPTVLTASVCDTLLILLAVGGISMIVLQTALFKYLLTGFGVIFLMVMGIMTWRAKIGKTEGEGENWGPKQQMLFAASVSLLNPHAILDTIGVIGTSSLAYAGQEKFFFVGGCIVNSWLWFFGLMLLGHRLGALPKAGIILRWLNRLSAIIIWGCAVLLGSSLLK